ncbi:unnamed protein product [Allacma fusca]|uniref:Uncharacterized protein n=1 Tax=Allacma fusca TaxID=39272 RepID=A0A8J2Q7E1_9HEXA|nr:unnamed protein product [Allacma fusca]
MASKPEEFVQYALLLIWDVFRSMIRLGSKVTILALNERLPEEIATMLSYFTGLLFAILVTFLSLNILSVIVMTFFNFLIYPSLVVLLALVLIKVHSTCGGEGLFGLGPGRCS